jgi:Mg/Co/Ni transporter MgtE
MVSNEEKSLRLGVAAGFVVGIIWIAMALAALWQSHWGRSNGRADWALAWGLIGLLLLAAGVAAIAGALHHKNLVESHH